MFQQQEIPGQRHVFERLKSVQTDAEAEKLAEPFPTESLLPELVGKALQELNPKLPFYKTQQFKGAVCLLLGLFLLTTNTSKALGWLQIFYGVIGILCQGSAPTKRTLLIANLLYGRLRERRETIYCRDVIRFLGVTGSRNDGALKALRGWLFATLPLLTESEALALPEDTRVVLRRWLRAGRTRDAERVVLLLVLASARDEKAKALAQRYANVPSESVREAARELLAP